MDKKLIHIARSRTFPKGVPEELFILINKINSSEPGRKFFDFLRDYILYKEIITNDYEDKLGIDNGAIMLEGQRRLINIFETIRIRG